jgi:hypothetical protein
MKPYTLLSHIIDEQIASVLNTERYAYMYFPDHIRFDHGLLTKQPGLSKDGIVRETDGAPWTWLETKYHGSNYSYHCGTWLPGAVPHGGGAEFKRRGMNFIEHHWEPVIYNLDKIFWDDVKREGKHIVLHSEHNSKDIAILRDQGFPDVHWFSHAYLCSEVYFKHYKKLKMFSDYKARPINHAWMCANRLIDGLRKYRIEFLNLIDLSKGAYSLLEQDPQTQRTLKEIYPLNAADPISFDSHENHSAEIEVHYLTPWNTSFLHVVSETVWQDKIHFTEKVFKPIVLHQPFVVLQAPGSLAYLRSYGFKTFGDWWDESYDTIEDPTERMQAIADIVNSIGNKSLEELETMRMEMASVLEHNFRHFYENIPAICLDELRKGITNL